MMRRKSMVSVLVLAAVMISACSGDEKVPDQKFSFEGKNVSLANARLYLASETIVDDHLIRDYYISDGNYIGGEGRNLASYVNATYALAIKIGVPKTGDVVHGDFPQYEEIADVPEESNFSHITFISSNYRFQTSLNVTNGPAVNIAGGVEPEDTMIIRFNGQLSRYFVVTEELDGQYPGTFHFKGTVQDERP